MPKLYNIMLHDNITRYFVVGNVILTLPYAPVHNEQSTQAMSYQDLLRDVRNKPWLGYSHPI